MQVWRLPAGRKPASLRWRLRHLVVASHLTWEDSYEQWRSKDKNDNFPGFAGWDCSFIIEVLTASCLDMPTRCEGINLPVKFESMARKLVLTKLLPKPTISASPRTIIPNPKKKHRSSLLGFWYVNRKLWKLILALQTLHPLDSQSVIQPGDRILEIGAYASSSARREPA